LWPARTAVRLHVLVGAGQHPEIVEPDVVPAVAGDGSQPTFHGVEPGEVGLECRHVSERVHAGAGEHFGVVYRGFRLEHAASGAGAAPVLQDVGSEGSGPSRRPSSASASTGCSAVVPATVAKSATSTRWGRRPWCFA
jgi:hypothetical protein